MTNLSKFLLIICESPQNANFCEPKFLEMRPMVPWFCEQRPTGTSATRPISLPFPGQRDPPPSTPTDSQTSVFSHNTTWWVCAWGKGGEQRNQNSQEKEERCCSSQRDRAMTSRLLMPQTHAHEQVRHPTRCIHSTWIRGTDSGFPQSAAYMCVANRYLCILYLVLT